MKKIQERKMERKSESWKLSIRTWTEDKNAGT